MMKLDGGAGGRGAKGREVAQTMYTHLNKHITNKTKNK
jgi:hypothetical protein